MKVLISILMLAIASENVLCARVPASAKCNVEWDQKSWTGICVVNDRVDYKRPFLKNTACSKRQSSDWCSVASIPCAGKENPNIRGVCFNVGSECTGNIYFYETNGDELLCPGGLACCTGGTIAGPNPILNNKPLYVGIDGIKYADQDNGLNLADLYNVPVASGADSFTVATNPLFSDVPDFSLLAAPPGIDLSDQAFLPSDSSSFRTSFNDDLFPTPSETDYTAFLGPSDSSGFLSASVADGTNSIFSGSGEWSAGSDLFPQDIFNT